MCVHYFLSYLSYNLGSNLQVRKMTPMSKCLKPVFLILPCRGPLYWLQKEVSLYESQYENDPTSHLIYELS